MPDTPTFGRYAEIPYDQMTPEQQEFEPPKAKYLSHVSFARHFEAKQRKSAHRLR
jgi:hypothetical protein